MDKVREVVVILGPVCGVLFRKIDCFDSLFTEIPLFNREKSRSDGRVGC